MALPPAFAGEKNAACHPSGLKIRPVKWKMSSFTYQRPTCKGHDTIQQQRLKLYPTLQKHTHHQSIAVDRGQSGNSLQLFIPDNNNNNSVKGSCNHHYSYYIKQQRKTKRFAAADIHQISLLSYQPIMSGHYTSWASFKGGIAPFGQVPLLEIKDGTSSKSIMLCQYVAILRYLANEFGR